VPASCGTERGQRARRVSPLPEWLYHAFGPVDHSDFGRPAVDLMSGSYMECLVRGMIVVHHLLSPHFFVWFVEYSELIHHNLIPHS
jgi:hypothetical protein